MNISLVMLPNFNNQKMIIQSQDIFQNNQQYINQSMYQQNALLALSLLSVEIIQININYFNYFQQSILAL